MNAMTYHIFWMTRAVWIAKKALSTGKIPIASILVKNNFEIGMGLNFKQFNYYPFAHAEINSLKQASFYCNNRLLKECIIYTTLEPCSICLSSLLLFNIKLIIFGAHYTKQHCTQIKNKKKITIIGGILEKECTSLLKNFYSKK